MPEKSQSKFQSPLLPYHLSKALPIEINCLGIIEKQFIEIQYSLSGAMDTVRFDKISKNSRRTDKLWQKTCCELFVKSDATPNYWEYNFSPSLNWAVYGFEKYRAGKFDELSVTDIPIKTSLQPDLFRLECRVPVPGPLIDQNLKIGLSSVVQDIQGDIYYYALKHTGKQPDFHDENSFIIDIRS